MRRKLIITLFSLAVLGGVIAIAYGYWEATRSPILREMRFGYVNWPDDEPPLRLLLISDLHVALPDMPPARLAEIGRQASALKPDAILIAGDLVSDKALSGRVGTAEAIAPLGRFEARLGTYLAWGNHDHWRGVTSIRRALRPTGVKLLRDDAVKIGPLILGGIDDSVTDHSDFEGTLKRMRALGPGPKMLLSHGVGHHKWLPDDVPLMLAGHEHCGQINLPLPGWPKRACGIVRRGKSVMVVSAGLGTSILPLRINAPPDMWMVTVGPGTTSPSK